VMYAATDQGRRAAIESRHPHWIEMSLDFYLESAGRSFRARPLVITDDKTLTYGEVIEQKRRVAAALRSMGLRSGDRVGILMANHADVVPLLFAVWSIGAVAVPFNTLYRADELVFALRQSGCAALITMQQIFGRNIPAELDVIEPDWRQGSFAQLPEMKTIKVFGVEEGNLVSFQALIDSQRPNEEVTHTSCANPFHTAVIMYTSGSTGLPKGVMHTHDSLLRAAYCNAYHHAYEDGRRAIFSLPLYHTYGLVTGLLSGLMVGGGIIAHTQFDAVRMLSAIGTHRATWLLAVPTMTVALLKEAEQRSYDLSSLKAIHSAAAPTPSWVWRKIKDTLGVDKVFTSYGQTETSMITCTQSGDSLETVSLTQGVLALGGAAGIPELGHLIANVRIVDPETGKVLPEGVTGELCTKGPTNTIGYFRNEAETAALFTPDGWLKMGDLGRFREDGNLVLVGRSKDVFKSRGELVSPKELEELLTTHAGISQAFVIGMPDEQSGECGCAWIVRANPNLEADEIARFLEMRVARYKMLRDIWFIEDHELPKTGTGKIQKQFLRDRAKKILAKEKVVDGLSE